MPVAWRSAAQDEDLHHSIGSYVLQQQTSQRTCSCSEALGGEIGTTDDAMRLKRLRGLLLVTAGACCSASDETPIDPEPR